jgi:tagatose 6-phosphate kinase
VIVTVTLNAALDVTYRVQRLRPHTTHRVSDTAERPGGKGINVARVLAALGHPAVATGFAGGPTGELLRAGLQDVQGVVDALVPIAGSTRRTVGVVDDTTGDATLFNEPGPTVTSREWELFLARYRTLLPEAAAVALCGSVPPGLPVGCYATLVREARTAGVTVLLDSSGEALRRGLAARPHLVKPNSAELRALTGSTEPLAAAHDVRRRGARAMAASLGADGLLAVTEDSTVWRARLPGPPLVGNPTGAGDAAVAALLSGLVEGLDWPARLARAVALSAATVRAPAAGEFDAAAYAELLPLVEVTPGGDRP